jgi:hypothetical protein
MASVTMRRFTAYSPVCLVPASSLDSSPLNMRDIVFEGIEEPDEAFLFYEVCRYDVHSQIYSHFGPNSFL